MLCAKRNNSQQQENVKPKVRSVELERILKWANSNQSLVNTASCNKTGNDNASSNVSTIVIISIGIVAIIGGIILFITLSPSKNTSISKKVNVIEQNNPIDRPIPKTNNDLIMIPESEPIEYYDSDTGRPIGKDEVLNGNYVITS